MCQCVKKTCVQKFQPIQLKIISLLGAGKTSTSPKGEEVDPGIKVQPDKTLLLVCQ